jgi:hypothetical protein
MAFKKGISGNPSGRPKGNNKVLALRQQIIAELPEIIETLLLQAKNGDPAAIKLLLDRAMPALRPQSEPVSFTIAANDGLAGIGQSIIDSVSRAEIPADIGAQLITALGTQARIVETDELLKRIEALETKS